MLENEICNFINEADSKGRLGIIFSGRNKTYTKIRDFLIAKKIDFRDNIQPNGIIDYEIIFQKKLISTLKNNFFNEDVISLVKILCLYEKEPWSATKIKDYYIILDKLHKNSNIHNAKILISIASTSYSASEEFQALKRLIDSIDIFPTKITLGDFKNHWQKLMEDFEISTFNYDSLFSKLETVVGMDKIDTVLFLDFLDSLLSNESKNKPDYKSQPYANIVLSSIPAASSQQWHSLIFSDSNFEDWQANSPENPFLEKALSTVTKKNNVSYPSQKLNRKLFYYKQIAILKNCSHRVSFFSWQKNDKDSDIFFPSQVSHNVKNTLAEIYPNADFNDNSLFYQTKNFKAKRNLPKIQNFDFSKIKNHPLLPNENFWSASQLGKIYDCPQAFALKIMLEEQSNFDYNFHSSDNLAIGNIVHFCLESILNGIDYQSFSILSNAEIHKKISNLVFSSKQKFTNPEIEKFSPSDYQKNLASVHRAIWLAYRIFKNLQEIIFANYTENKKFNKIISKTKLKNKFAVEIKSENGQDDILDFAVSGKLDSIAFGENNDNITIFDFKTGDFQDAHKLQMLAYKKIIDKKYESKSKIFLINLIKGSEIRKSKGADEMLKALTIYQNSWVFPVKIISEKSPKSRYQNKLPIAYQHLYSTSL